MIRTNLSTRPFYDERAVSRWLLVALIAAVGATAFNITHAINDWGSNAELVAQASTDEALARNLRRDAARLRGSLDAAQVASATAEADQANSLIDRRVFSWTGLLNLFEQALPADVRITAVRPKVDREGHIVVTITVLARSVDGVNRFMEGLDTTRAFLELRSTQERTNEQDQIESTLEMVYVSPPAGVSVPDTAAAANRQEIRP